MQSTRIRLTALALGLWLLPACGDSAEAPDRKPATDVAPRHAAGDSPVLAGTSRPVRRVVVDTDFGLDDVRALFALLAADGIAVDGVATGEGSASVGRATDHVIGLLESVGCEGIPVAPGGRPRTELAAPPWRSTADALAGAKFPPPRGRQARVAGARELLGAFSRDRAGERHLLALGPLGNLAGLEASQVGEAAALPTVWIPAEVVADGEVKAWNLRWDPEATRRVFARFAHVVLVDIGSAGNPDLDTILGGAEDETPALAWIRRVRAATSEASPHRFVYDELAVAALCAPSLVRIGPARHRLVTADGDRLHLVEDAAGNVSVARFKSPDAVGAWLRARWCTPASAYPVRRLPHDHSHPHAHAAGAALDHTHAAAGQLPAGSSLTAYLRAFHGHLGPYVVIGYRLGRDALERLGSDGHFGIHATVRCAPAPPASCFADGVQLGAGCTFGKRNIELVGADGPPEVTFRTGAGRHLTLRVKAEIPGRIKSWVDSEGVEAAGRRFLAMPLASFLERVR